MKRSTYIHKQLELLAEIRRRSAVLLERVNGPCVDSESAHGDEDDLMCNFIEIVAGLDLGEVSETAAEIKKINDTDYTRWYA